MKDLWTDTLKSFIGKKVIIHQKTMNSFRVDRPKSTLLDADEDCILVETKLDDDTHQVLIQRYDIIAVSLITEPLRGVSTDILHSDTNVSP